TVTGGQPALGEGRDQVGVGRGEPQRGEVLPPDPAELLAAVRARALAGGPRAAEEAEHQRAGPRGPHERADLELDAELLAQLAPQGGGIVLAALALAPRELPPAG